MNFPAATAVSLLQVTPKSGFPGQMCGSAYASNGTLFAGDNNYRLYRSDDNGATYYLVTQFPMQPNPTSLIAGYVWMIFIDSRDCIFVSIPATNRLYRSTDFGVTFNEVLCTNASINEGFYIAMTEDYHGNLYAATYTNIRHPQNPPLLKSSDGGATWHVIRRFQTIHLHNVKFNPANGYLYVATGEWTYGFNNQECERVFRSKDLGQTWSAVISRPMEVEGQGATVYLPMLFKGNYVYLGSDQGYQPNWIDRFYDDGSDRSFVGQRVYSFPSDGYFPVISATWLNDTMLFASSAEFYSGTQRIIASVDGENWNIIRETSVTKAAHHTNILTSNPKGTVFFSEGYGKTYMISLSNMPLSPAPSPTITRTPTPMPPPTPIATPPSVPTATPTLTPAASPTPSLFSTLQDTPSIASASPDPTETPPPLFPVDRQPTPPDRPTVKQSVNIAPKKTQPTTTPIPAISPLTPIPKSQDRSRPTLPELPHEILKLAICFVFVLVTSVAILAKKARNSRLTRVEASAKKRLYGAFGYIVVSFLGRNHATAYSKSSNAAPGSAYA